jgi:hypothetical protein
LALVEGRGLAAARGPFRRDSGSVTRSGRVTPPGAAEERLEQAAVRVRVTSLTLLIPCLSTARLGCVEIEDLRLAVYEHFRRGAAPRVAELATELSTTQSRWAPAWPHSPLAGTSHSARTAKSSWRTGSPPFRWGSR